MNEFNKKYLQIAKSYNYKPDQIIQEGFLDDTGNFIKGKAKVLYNKLVTTVKSWFNSCKDQKSAKENAQKAKKLVGIKTEDNVVTEEILTSGIFILLPILKKFDWFKTLCDIVKKYYYLFTSKEQKNKYIRYLKYNKKLTYDQYKQLGYFEKQKQLYNYIKNLVKNEKVVTEDIICQTPLHILIGIALIIVAIAVLFFTVAYVMKFWFFVGETDGEKKIRQANEKMRLKQIEVNNKIKDLKLTEKMQQLNLTQLTNLLKGCDALK